MILTASRVFVCAGLSVFAYYQAGGIFYLFIATLVMFFLVYAGGCYFAAKEANHFLDRFKEKARARPMSPFSCVPRRQHGSSCLVAWLLAASARFA